jgi:HD-GYP domain-containing protein (c-di-GMP phosphodiesterase class II)
MLQAAAGSGESGSSFNAYHMPATHYDIEGRAMTDVPHIKLSEVIAALSYALDLTEGQLEGHTLRSCLIGMRLARALDLPTEQQSALFYALLLKDVGCSSNAARLCALFGTDDRRAKRDLKVVDWSQPLHALFYTVRHAAPHQSFPQRVRQLLAIKAEPDISQQLFTARCERGAEIVNMLEFGPATVDAIRTLDKHWDGRGQPLGLQGEEIPLLGRILCLSQTVEVFFSMYDQATALDMARKRRGTWFDSQLVDTLLSLDADTTFWQQLTDRNLQACVAEQEPPDHVLLATDARLDRVATAFAQVVDTKSPWTAQHSTRVAQFAVGIAETLEFSPKVVRDLRRAALLHDLGKLGISNRILDKPGPLTDDEHAQMRLHPMYTQRILERVACFRDLANVAASHHERLDGRGYHRGLMAAQLSPAARVLTVADICEALSAERPYRAALPWDQVLTIMRRDVGVGICPVTFEALETFLKQPKHVLQHELVVASSYAM